MINPWLEYVKKVWEKNKGKKSYKTTLMESKKTYKKGSKSKSISTSKGRQSK